MRFYLGIGLGILLSANSIVDAADSNLDQDKAIAALKRLGARIVVEKNGRERRVVEVDFQGNKIIDDDLKHLEQFPQLERLDLYNTGVTDKGLAHLEGLTGLRYLEVNGLKITDAGLVHFRALTGLEALHLCGTGITDDGLENLHKLKNLRIVDVTATEVGTSGIVALEKALPQVKVIGPSGKDK